MFSNIIIWEYFHIFQTLICHSMILARFDTTRLLVLQKNGVVRVQYKKITFISRPRFLMSAEWAVNLGFETTFLKILGRSAFAKWIVFTCELKPRWFWRSLEILDRGVGWVRVGLRVLGRPGSRGKRVLWKKMSPGSPRWRWRWRRPGRSTWGRSQYRTSPPRRARCLRRMAGCSKRNRWEMRQTAA